MLKIFALQVQNIQLHNDSKDTAILLEQAKIRLQDAEDIIVEKTAEVDEQVSLTRSLRRQINDMPNEDEKMAVLQSMVLDATQVAGTLKKLSDTDKQLLAKYSKVYFLNEHYEPKNLRRISKRWGNSSLRLRSEAYYFLDKMFRQMASSGLKPRVVSAYRSFTYQKSLKAKYTEQFGSGANTFSADQGFSEHQLGTTADITHFVDEMELFDKTGEYAWMQQNAHKYGFVLSYPKDNGHYTFEPWHWRFVGTALATRLHGEGKHFYDLSQRDINKYLLNMFDK
jgi:LAS superfamily LD-carboxypeptidase LdcB